MNATAFTPWAEIAACHDLPTMRAPFEPAVEPEIGFGTLLDRRFVVREIVSRSFVSTIYRAEDLDYDRHSVAVKVPLLRVESDPAGFDRFVREERIGLSLRHPGLLRFVPVAMKLGRPHFVTEFLDGCTLADLLHEMQRLDETSALRLAAAICEPLTALHASGFVHRDLKPANIVLCRDLSLRIIDFGAAAPPDRRRSLLAALTPPFGTPEYMAPEQVERRPNDERTDLYSVGAMLYEMLVGEPPFKQPDAWLSAYQRAAGDPVAPRKLNPSISVETEEIVLRALRHDPTQRYPSAEALRKDLVDPGVVYVTGIAQRLRRPRWQISLHGTPLMAGSILGLVAVIGLLLVALALAKLRFGH